jgi:hypothetical protein
VDIVKEYEASVSQISQLKRGDTYKHVCREIERERRYGRPIKHYSMTVTLGEITNIPVGGMKDGTHEITVCDGGLTARLVEIEIRTIREARPH